MRVDIVKCGIMASGKSVTDALAAGIRAQGDEVRYEQPRTARRGGSDAVAVWGWNRGKHRRRMGREVLVLERGYLGDRLSTWTSLGWNGLNGRAAFGEFPGDGGERFERYFAGSLRPWSRRKQYALILGQVPGDMSCDGVNMEAWYIKAAAAMEARGFTVGFREHPSAIRRGLKVRALPDKRVGGTLEEALSVAAVAVTWNSNAGVDAVLAGVPVIACDPGAMCWPVAAHGLEAEIVRPDREDWAARLAWTQWTIDEIETGEAWAHLRPVRFPVREDEAEGAVA